jgi:hypothetical protein
MFPFYLFFYLFLPVFIFGEAAVREHLHYLLCTYEVDFKARPKGRPPSRRSRTDQNGTEKKVDRVVRVGKPDVKSTPPPLLCRGL